MRAVTAPPVAGIRRRGLLAWLAATVLVVTACSSGGTHGDSSGGGDGEARPPLSELTIAPDPRAYEGPSTATLTNEAVESIADNPEQSLPATVTSYDQAGEKSVEITDTSRVVAMNLSGSLAATVWGLGLGDTLVGRDQSTTFPGAADLPVVTESGHSINAESVLALEPTLVITDGSIGPRDVVEQLRDTGVTVVFVENVSSFDGASSLARQVAAIYGVPEEGEKLAEQIESQVEDVKEQIKAIAPTEESDRVRMLFLYVRGSAGVYYLFGEESGADDLIEGLGGIDIAKEQGWKEMRPMTDEAMTAADPDLILVMTGGLESTGGVDGLLAEKPAIALTSAGEHRRFVDMADGDILSFGPRSAQVLDALARAVYAPESGS